MAGEGDAVILIILAWLFPPAAVALVSGCGADLCLNILLTILGYLPGCLHAFWLVLRRAEANDRYGYKNWTYAGMGEYRPGYGAPPGVQPPAAHGQAQPPPPPGPYPPPNVPPPSQAAVDQKGDTAPPAPAESKHDAGDKAADLWPAPSSATDQKQSQDPPPQAPADQKQADQKQADTTAQSTAPASST